MKMTFRKSFMTTGLLLAVAGVALADPTVKILRSGAKSGAKAGVTIQGITNGSTLTAAQLIFTFDTAKAAISGTVAGDYIAGNGWTVNDKNVAGNTVTIAMSNANGQTSDGPIVTVMATNSTGATSTLTLDPSSNIADDQFATYNVSGSGVLVGGAVRNLSGVSNNSIAVGVSGTTKVVAAIVGTKLYIMNAADGTDMAGFASGKDLGAVSTGGRPAFGVLAGVPVVAAGADNGTVNVYNLADGTAVAGSSGSAGGQVVGAPAIDTTSNSVFVSVSKATGPSVTKVGGTASSIGGAADTITSSPLVQGGKLLVGTSTGLKSFNVDASGSLSAQADAVTGDNVNTSPVAAGGMALVGASTGKVYKVNIATGTPAGNAANLPATAAPLSDPFYVGSTDSALFGGADGKLYSVKSADLSFTATNFSTGALISPVGTALGVTAGDNLGKVGTPGGALTDLGGALGKAVARTGTAATDSVVVNTADGDVVILAGS